MRPDVGLDCTTMANQTGPPSSAAAPSTESVPVTSQLSDQALCLSPGDRIEVLWRIEREEDDEDSEDKGNQSAGCVPDGRVPLAASSDQSPAFEERWWGARVLRVDGAPAPGGARAYIVEYDAYAEFAPVQVRVCVTGRASLRDGSANDEVLRWRREGEVDSGAGLDNAVEGDRGDAQAADDVYSMRDVARAQDEVDAEEGVRASDVMMAALGTLPMTKQTELAVAYREFADQLKRELGLFVSSKGPGYVVTDADIQGLFSKLRGASGSSVHI